MGTDEVFAANVRQLRGGLRLTQAELGAAIEAFGVALPVHAIYKIEAGSRRVTVGEAVAISQALGSSIEEMVLDQEGVPESVQQALAIVEMAKPPRDASPADVERFTRSLEKAIDILTRDVD